MTELYSLTREPIVSEGALRRRSCVTNWLIEKMTMRWFFALFQTGLSSCAGTIVSSPLSRDCSAGLHQLP